MRTRPIAATVLCGLALALPATPSLSQDATPYAAFDDAGQLLRPTGYREWIFVGTGTTPEVHDAEALFPDFQNVYIDPVSYAAWIETGEFPEGAILVKELLTLGETETAVGRGFWQDDYRSLSATVRSTARYPDTVGNWNYFNFTDAEAGVLTPAAAPLGTECSDCHVGNAPEGGVFHDLYPVLRVSRGAGERVEDRATRGALVPE